MIPYITLNYFKIVQTNKNVTEQIFKILNKMEFSLKSLVVENVEFQTYDFEDFFVKHCSGLRSLELKYLLSENILSPGIDPNHNPLIIASRRVFYLSGIESSTGFVMRHNSCHMLVFELNWVCWRRIGINFYFNIQLEGFIPIKYESIKRYSKSITHLTIHNTSDYGLLPSIKHEMLQSLVYLDIDIGKKNRLNENAGLRISSLNKNLKYFRLSGAVQLNTTGKDLRIES